MEKKYDVIVLGAGITGLVSAYELSKRGKKVLIVERKGEPGGLLSSIKVGDAFLEVFYHHVFVNDIDLKELVRELGMEDKLEWKYTTTAFLYPDGIYEMSSPLHILSFKPLNLVEKIKFAILMLKIKFTRNTENLDETPVERWIVDNSDQYLYDNLFFPMLKSKYGNRLDDISAAWFIERIKLRSNRDVRGEKLGYIKGGFEILVDKLVEKIKENGGEIVFNSEVEKVIIRKRNVVGVKIKGKEIRSEFIISTIPPDILLGFGIFDDSFEERIRKTEYQGSAVVMLGLKKKITDYYWTNIVSKSLIGAIVEHTNFQPLDVYKDHVVYLASYPDNESEIWRSSKKNVFEKYFSELQRLFPHVKKSDVVWWKVFREKKAGLVYRMGFKKHILGFKTPIEGFFMGGMFNNYPERSISLCVRIGKSLASLCE